VKYLGEKLHSQRGATLLVALLFFLVCVMVAASVLMAAASNGGKIRSNYDEQQKYLALSSAIRLVSDQIKEAEYTGDYTVNRWRVDVYEINDEGALEKVDSIQYFQVCQEKGTFTCGALTNVSADTVLDLTKELDGLYAKEFKGTGYKALEGSDDIASLPTERTLSVTADGGTGIEEKFPPVMVKVRVDTGCRVHLTAALAEAGSANPPDPENSAEWNGAYKLEAVLSAVGSPVMDFIPAADEYPAPGRPAASGNDVVEEITPPGKRTPSRPDIKWKLEWIDRKEAGMDAGEAAGWQG